MTLFFRRVEGGLKKQFLKYEGFFLILNLRVDLFYKMAFYIINDTKLVKY